MTLARREFTVVDQNGNIVTDAQIEVRKEIAGQPLAAIFSDRAGATPLTNPFNVDPVTAVAAFHVAGGAFQVRAFKIGFERIERYVAIGTAAEADAVTALSAVVEDTAPQLGGDLDANGHNIGFDDGKAITDDAGNEQIVLHKIASAVNQIGVTNAATGNAPAIAAEGGDTNIDLALSAKGTGAVKASAGYVAQATLTDAATITWNGATQQCATVTLGGNRTLDAISNPKPGATYILRVVQDGTGSRTLNLSNAIYKFPGGTEPTLSTAPGAIDVLSFYYDGTSMLGAIQKAFS